MKHSLALLVAVSALISFTAVLQAQDTGTPPEHNGRPPRHARAAGPGPRRQHGPPIVAALDVNRDRAIDATELAGAPVALKTLDKNGDGQLTQEELGPLPPPHAPRPPRAPADPGDAADAATDDVPAAPDVEHTPPPMPVMPLIKALDANADGLIDASEMANASTALLTLDVNKDGQLTPEEYRPAPPHVGHPGAGKGQHRPGPGHRPTPPADQEQQ